MFKYYSKKESLIIFQIIRFISTYHRVVVYKVWWIIMKEGRMVWIGDFELFIFILQS